MFRTTAFLLLVACAPNYRVVEPEGRTEPSFASVLEASSSHLMTNGSVMMLEQPLESSVIPEPIVEVREYRARQGATILIPPQVQIYRHAGNTDIEDSTLLTMQFTTGRNYGVSTRDAWILISPTLLEPPVDWGPISQHVPFDIVLPFPAGVKTDYGPNNQFHRQSYSGAIQLNGEIVLPSPMYLQLVARAPEENELGFVVSHAYALIPEGW